MDLNFREYSILLILVVFTVALGIYPSIITDGLNYVSSSLIYTFDIARNNVEILLLSLTKQRKLTECFSKQKQIVVLPTTQKQKIGLTPLLTKHKQIPTILESNNIESLRILTK